MILFGNSPQATNKSELRTEGRMNKGGGQAQIVLRLALGQIRTTYHLGLSFRQHEFNIEHLVLEDSKTKNQP